MRVLAIFVLASLTALAGPFTPPDTLAIKTITEIAPSPDGKTILFSVATVDLTANKTLDQWMRIPAQGGNPEPAAADIPSGANTLRWSPDGTRVAFIAQREKSNGIFVLQIASGRLIRVCDYRRSNSFLTKAGNMLAWSPDGKQLAFAGTLDPDPAKSDPVVITRLMYKTRTSLSDNRHTHIYVVAADPSAEPRALTNGNYDEHSLDWGANGEIVFVSNHEPTPDARLNYDIFAANPKTGGIRQITHTPGVEMDPRVSPDGRSIAYIATKGKITTIDSVAEDDHAWMIPLDGGESKELNAKLDRRTSTVQWSPDGKSVLYTVGDHGSVELCTTMLSTDESSCPAGKGAQIMLPAVARDGSVTFTLSKPDMAPELFRLDEGSREPRQLTHLNTSFVAALELSTPEDVHFESFDGTPVQGWFYPAVGKTGKTPLILTIHGGPHGQFGYGFNPQAQAFAGHGYAVLAINPRGSSGYGQKFSNGSVEAWGGGDYKDLMAGLDIVLKKQANIDPDRLFVTGGSYGGFMTNWVITQTHRFKAAVAVASVSDLISFYATSLYQDLVHAEFDGFPWTGNNYAMLWKWSPLAHAGNAKTPTMFLHGESDNDVHITQAEQMYTALREQGIEAELVRYPREGHGFHEPKHRLDALNRTLQWFDKFQ